MNIHALLEGMAKMGASDLHLKVGSPPMLRINGTLRPVEHPPLDEKTTAEVMQTITPPMKRKIFDEVGTADFSYSIPKVARFRVNIFHQRGSVSIAIRLVTFEIPDFQKLLLPPVVAEIADEKRGLVLVTGVTGSGKSSTLAAMIQHINNTRREHIITIEDPIEFLFRDNLSIINQMELGVDVRSFDVALKHVLRQDPDIIMIGELRDRDTVKTALMATETGHMVFGTLHTSDAKQTINRLLHFFPSEDQELILEQLSLNLRAVISQRLVRRCDTKGRAPAVEVLRNIPIVSKLIREGRITEISQAIRNQEMGMQTFDQSLTVLVQQGIVALDEALKYSAEPEALKRNVKGIYAEGERRGLIGV
ncbi:MAG: type IV pilus twitching motility protein PilT [Candidatus Sumerlaeia bacterium]|nr:type IV pilus twitching motility protein PilT [Candidatus Sumerlaeia bacterium]